MRFSRSGNDVDGQGLACRWSHLGQTRRLVWAIGPALPLLIIAVASGPLLQPEDYHRFRDGRELLGLPNFLNVVSNLPFLAIGLLGLAWLASAKAQLPRHLKLCYAVLFAGIGLTAAGSAYYHWAPDNNTLVWDRLPMAVAFMGLFAGFLTERLRLDDITSVRLLVALVAFGVGSVAYWSATGDLSVYALAQFYPIVAIPIILWATPASYTRGGDWLVAIAIYVGAKVLEHGDGAVLQTVGYVSGHTLKHLAAAGGAWWIYRMLRRRQPVTATPDNSVDYPLPLKG
ncbi:MAG: hypothetical protein AB7E81_15540 [Hyphomicrobiaceae bacterium]